MGGEFGEWRIWGIWLIVKLTGNLVAVLIAGGDQNIWVEQIEFICDSVGEMRYNYLVIGNVGA